MAMIPRERTPFSAIVDRPPMKLPGNNRIIVWTIVNLEVWDIAKPMARQVLPPPTGADAAARRAQLVAGTSTACASASGASTRCTSASASARRCRSTRA